MIKPHSIIELSVGILLLIACLSACGGDSVPTPPLPTPAPLITRSTLATPSPSTTYPAYVRPEPSPIPTATSFALPSDWKAQEDNIAEAVFRYEMQHFQIYGDICLAFDIKTIEPLNPVDPSDEFMRRFAGTDLKKASQCVTDSHAGRESTFLRVDEITWISPDDVKVVGGYWHGGLDSSLDTYTLTRSSDTWVVTDDHVDGIG